MRWAALVVSVAVSTGCAGDPGDLDQAMCEAMGLRWLDGECVEPDVDCEAMGLVWIDGMCGYDEATCLGAGRTWNEGVCLSPEDVCEAARRVWLDGECLSLRESCRFGGELWLTVEGLCADSQATCEAASLVWMDDTCFDYARCTSAGDRCWIGDACVAEGALGPAGAVGGCPQCRPARSANDWSDTCFLHTSFTDFAAYEEGATLEGSDNLFISRDGHVELLRGADLDCDGHSDLVVTSAVSGDVGAGDPDTQTLVYRGTGTGVSAAELFDGFGVGGAVIADITGDGSLDVVLGNRALGAMGEPSPAYCGAPSPICTEQALDPAAGACETFDAADAEEVEVADIDQDGYLDIIFASSTLNVFWSGESRRRTTFDTGRRGARIADLNDDGIPDLVAAGDTDANVFFGDGGRFGSTEVPDEALTGSGASACIADLDGDGWLEVVVASGDASEATIHWGPIDGRPRSCPGSNCEPVTGSDHATACSIADLDGDGRLDLAFSRDAGSGSPDLPSTVHLAVDSFAATALPGSRAGAGITIAEIVDTGTGLDLFLALERSVSGEYGTDSLLYSGRGDGTFAPPLLVPSIGASRGVTHDFGNVHDRRAEDRYSSAPFDLGESLEGVEVTLTWDADARTPSSVGGVTLQVCVSETPECDAFLGPDGTSATSFDDATGSTFAASGRYLRYRAIFAQPDFLARPRLSEVALRY